MPLRSARRPALSPMSRAFACAVLLCLSLTGCFSVNYALQAGAGEFTLLTSARPIDDLIDRPGTPARLQRLLASVASVKAYGESMGLKPTESYQRYTQLDRPAAVWVVSACPELSLEPRLFDFPIAGAVPYLGWFELRAARDFARSLEAQHLDVSLRGAPAYSTLGWFNDPLLSSMIEPAVGEAALGLLVKTILHESVHATIYVAGQSSFNEGLAEFVAGKLTPGYLAQHASSREARAWASLQERSAALEKQLHAVSARLDALYLSAAPDAEKRARKQAELSALQAQLHWRRPVNNAVLAGYRTYSTDRRGFSELLDACGGDWHCFFDSLRALDRAWRGPLRDLSGAAADAKIDAMLLEKARELRAHR